MNASTPFEYTNRSVQAAWGLALLCAPDEARKDFARSALKELASLEGMDEQGLAAIRERARHFFHEIHRHLPDSMILSGDEDGVWALMFEGFDLRTAQLRAFPNWIHQADLLDHFAAHLETDARSLLTLPFTAQVVLMLRQGGGTTLYIENPAKLGYLDLLLLLAHSRREHRLLTKFGSVGPSTHANSARLDAYSRLTVLRAVSVVEGLLSDYGAFMEHAAPNDPEVARWGRVRGVTARVRGFFDSWKAVPQPPPVREVELENEFCKFIELRNRLAHPDDRPSSWQAFRSAPAGERLAGFPRAEALVGCAPYGIAGSHVGYEYGLACYAVDITTRMIDYILRVAFPAGPRTAPWLGVPRGPDGHVDFERFHLADPMLSVDDEDPPRTVIE